jgi:hypothetical protein
MTIVWKCEDDAAGADEDVSVHAGRARRSQADDSGIYSQSGRWIPASRENRSQWPAWKR